MTVEQNKEIVNQYFEAINNKNWDVVEELYHDDYAMDRSIIPLQDYLQEIRETRNNPFIEFFRLLGYENKISDEAQNLVLGIKDKKSRMNYMKWLSQYISNCISLDMIAEDDRVWIFMIFDFIAFNKHKIRHSGHEQITLKDSKIISHVGFGRFLASLMQIGKIIIASDNKEEIEKYLQGLRNLGILPIETEK